MQTGACPMLNLVKGRGLTVIAGSANKTKNGLTYAPWSSA